MLPLQTRVSEVVFNVAQTHAGLEFFASKFGIDVFLVTAQDAFLSEYTPLVNNQRAALSAFTGSTGDGIYRTQMLRERIGEKAAFQLFVDGRYHLQTDVECDPALVRTEKLSLATPVEKALVDALAALPEGLTVAFDARRTSLARARLIEDICTRRSAKLVSLKDDELSRALSLPGWSTDRAITPVREELTGRNPAQTVHTLLAMARRAAGGATTPCIASCASDDAAFLLNARGYHMPHQASFLAYTFVLPGRIVLFLPHGVHACEVNLPAKFETKDSHGNAIDALALTVVRSSLEELSDALSPFPVSHILFNDGQMNALLPEFLSRVWPEAKVLGGFSGVEILRARKTPEELTSFRDSNLRSSRAISRTLRWVKESVRAHVTSNAALPSEVDLSAKISEEYGREGALDLSFNSIAGSGPHGAIIHYGTPDVGTKLLPGEMTLLDSGAYYEPGFATDCTRVVYNGDVKTHAGGTPQAWQKEIYTVTLKAFLKGMRAEFPLAECGRTLDLDVRSVCRAHGYDYAHGTGHGVGIHVHEPGIRLGTASTYAMTENACVSMEPGIYLPGKGGVRIENVVRVEPRDERLGLYGFENFIWVGFDWDLVDVTLLDDTEKNWLRAYESRCQSLGTQVTECPLTHA